MLFTEWPECCFGMCSERIFYTTNTSGLTAVKGVHATYPDATYNFPLDHYKKEQVY